MSDKIHTGIPAAYRLRCSFGEDHDAPEKTVHQCECGTEVVTFEGDPQPVLCPGCKNTFWWS